MIATAPTLDGGYANENRIRDRSVDHRAAGGRDDWMTIEHKAVGSL
jgi:hypothetical protein